MSARHLPLSMEVEFRRGKQLPHDDTMCAGRPPRNARLRYDSLPFPAASTRKRSDAEARGIATPAREGRPGGSNSHRTDPLTTIVPSGVRVGVLFALWQRETVLLPEGRGARMVHPLFPLEAAVVTPQIVQPVPLEEEGPAPLLEDLVEDRVIVARIGGLVPGKAVGIPDCVDTIDRLLAEARLGDDQLCFVPAGDSNG